MWEFLPRGYLNKIGLKYFDENLKDYFFNRPEQYFIQNLGVTTYKN
jgi:hypothetical protein